MDQFKGHTGPWPLMCAVKYAAIIHYMNNVLIKTLLTTLQNTSLHTSSTQTMFS